MVIRPDDRLSDVIDRDPRVLDALLEASPELRGLGNPTTRRVMGRLATMRQIATMAGLEPEIFIRRLNRRLESRASAREARGDGESTSHETTTRKQSMSMDTNAAPAALSGIPEELVHELDVREDLRLGREPFSRIMAARQQIPTGGALRLRAIFEPVPLYAVMANQGFDHWTESLAADDWIVWFYPAGAVAGEAVSKAGSVPEEPARAAQEPSPAAGEAAETEDDEAMVILDVRGMEPPEPMVHTLAALETLPAGATLLQINERVPQFLLPKLEELGFGHQIRIQEEGVVRVFIRRTADR
jgi:hypothetical protein